MITPELWLFAALAIAVVAASVALDARGEAKRDKRDAKRRNRK